MNTDAALSKLRAILGLQAASLESPHPKEVWAAYKEFARLKVACAEDLLLFQCGVFDFTGVRKFHFDFVRQFTVEVDGEYGHMEQLHCEFTCDADPDLDQCSATLWESDFSTRDEFLGAEEVSSEFLRGMSVAGWQLELFQETV